MGGVTSLLINYSLFRRNNYTKIPSVQTLDDTEGKPNELF
jgi:hypothetical protein